MKSKLIVPTSACGDQFIREPKILDECHLFQTLEAKDWRTKELEKINTRLRRSLNRLYSSVSDGEHLSAEWIKDALLAEPNGIAVES